MNCKGWLSENRPRADRKWQLEGSDCGGHDRRSSCHWRALTLFTLWAADPRRTHRLFGNRLHPQTARIIHPCEKLSTIFCDAFDKKRRVHGPFDSTVRDAYTLPSVRASGVSGQVAQLVEHATENRGVGGSTPSLAIEEFEHWRGSSGAPVFSWCNSPSSISPPVPSQKSSTLP